MRVGFIGLGRMGKGMAHRILSEGHDLAVYDVAAQATVEFMKGGAHVATSIGEFFSTLMVTASWPIAGGKWPVALQIIPAVLVQWPMLLLIVQMLRQRPGMSDPRWFYVAIAAWVALQLIAVSLARAGDSLQSRYTDNFLIGTILNFAALLTLIGDRLEPQRRKLLSIGAALWIFVVMLGANHHHFGEHRAEPSSWIVRSQVREGPEIIPHGS